MDIPIHPQGFNTYNNRWRIIGMYPPPTVPDMNLKGEGFGFGCDPLHAYEAWTADEPVITDTSPFW